MAIATVAIFATTILISAIYYNIYRNQIIEDLQIITEVLVDTDFAEKEPIVPIKRVDGAIESVRITLINDDGTVRYDNEAENIYSLDNHNERPEVMEAKKTGSGTAIRHSDTVGRNSFYYARLLENGDVLRVSKEAGSLGSIFLNAFPLILLIALLLLFISFTASHYLTKRLVKPIERLAEHLDSEEENPAYEELDPFINTIKKQHEDIMKSAFMRQEFTANVSHELKTPLTSISGYAELIETGMASDEDVRRFAGEIHKNSNRLLTLINDIIRLSELDGTKQEVALEKVNLFIVAQTCVDMLQFSADKHNVKLYLEGEDCFIPGNRQMLDELLYNLCDNAIRYNNEGGKVTINVKNAGKNATLIVKDTGIGIPKEAQARVFERFYRVDKSRSKQTGGTGLGLAIVKHIISKLHAQINLNSEVGKGTEITVLFPKETETVI